MRGILHEVLVRAAPHAEVMQTHVFALSKMKECVSLMERHRIKNVPWDTIRRENPAKYEELVDGWKKNMAEIESAVETLQHSLREWK